MRICRLLLIFTLTARVVATATTILTITAYATAYAQQSAINTYAITGVRIVSAVGPIIERGTIIIRNGLIEAVGTSALVPADARVIDGTGLTAYPGLIDANTSLGIPAPPTPSQTSRSSGTAAATSPATAAPPPLSASSPNSTQPPGLQPEILAADLIRPGGDAIEAARNVGITAALTAPREGILIGQSALINLAGDTTQGMIVRSPVALHVGFTPLRPGIYPSSLMGVFAAIRQLLIDAERYGGAQQIYERGARGLRRPEQDKSLAALQPIITRQMPVVMYADQEREIIRALDLAQEFNLRLIIAGGSEAWKVAGRLRAAGVPVLLSLNFPRRTTTQVPETDPDSLRILQARVDAPKTAGRLATAGVSFAFQSGALPNPSDFLSNAAKAVENGLSSDEAVRAMTIRAAEILGVADRLGSIEPGKIANLTVTRGGLLKRSPVITHVFIDGRPVDLKPAAPTSTTASVTTSGATGTWTLRVNTGEGREESVTLALQQQGERLSGSLQGALGTGQIANASIELSGELRFTAPVQVGGQTTEATFIGTITGNEMRGTVQIIGRGAGSFTGTRPGSNSSGTPASDTPATDTPATDTPATDTPASDTTSHWPWQTLCCNAVNVIVATEHYSYKEPQSLG